MNNLFIYGCSHSVAHKIPDDKFWGLLLAEKLKLNTKDPDNTQNNIRACPGRGVGHIMSKLNRDIYNREFKKGDVVIWNTSYPARFSTPYVNSDIDDGIFGQDWFDRAEYKITDMRGKKRKLWSHDMKMAGFWFQETVVGYEMLKKMDVEVYQWNLFSTKELDSLLELVTDWSHNELISENRYGPNHCLNDRIGERPVSSWENLILPPSESWLKFIETAGYMLGEGDTHMNVRGHKRFSEHFYEKIMEIRSDRNKT
tara:strand:+ start:1377 stop:2144 length:768 start_codon:yes stop_codon:yes gene_type:complete